MQSPITTATSQEEGRLKVGVSSSYNKKKKDSIKAIVGKYKKRDGKGGTGNTNAVNSPLEKSGSADSGVSQTPASSYVPIANSAPTLTQSDKTTGYRMARSLKLKRLNKLQSSISGINKKMKGR